MAELPDRDAALLLDMLLAARGAQAFVEGLDESAFIASRLHQNADSIAGGSGRSSGQGLRYHTALSPRNSLVRNHRDASSSDPCVRRGATRSCLDGAP